MAQRRFPKPWTLNVLESSIIVVDANGDPIAYTYYDDDEFRRAGGSRRLMTKDEARRIATTIARIPELLAIEKVAKSGFAPDDV